MLVGIHKSLPSESLQQTPVPTSATKGADIRSKRGYNYIDCNKETTLKMYKNEKAENSNSDKGAREKKTKNDVIYRLSASRKKTLD